MSAMDDAMSAADSEFEIPTPLPPKSQRANTGGPGIPPKSTKKGPATTESKLADKLEGDLLQVGLMLSMVPRKGFEFDGLIVAAHAKKVAESHARLAMEYPRYKKFLETGLQGGAAISAILATAGMLIPILANHGVLPISMADMVRLPPEFAEALRDTQKPDDD